MKLINEQISPAFVKQALILSKYTALLRKILPAECLNHVEVANIRNQNLMLITDSPVWTTKLRQLSPQILQALTANPVTNDPTGSESSAEDKPKIHHVQISTRYKHSHHTTQGMNTSAAEADAQKKQHPKISAKTAEILSQSADSINHQQLKESLLKIASHASGSTTKKRSK